ncbi:MAG: hypothetical protein ACR2N7_12960 [Acidimicrobiia bacterium]
MPRLEKAAYYAAIGVAAIPMVAVAPFMALLFLASVVNAVRGPNTGMGL